jgi:hypothetical protein
MKNNIVFYRHKVNSYTDLKFKALRQRHGWAGEGKYYALLCLIGEAEGCWLDLNNRARKLAVAAELDFDEPGFEEFKKYLIDPCELLKKDNGKITTDELQELLTEVNLKREKDRELKRKKKQLTNNSPTKINNSPPKTNNSRINSTVQNSTVQKNTQQKKAADAAAPAAALIMEIIKETANTVFRDNMWKVNTMKAHKLSTEELKGWMSLFNNSLEGDPIEDFNETRYKKMFSGWLNKQIAKGYVLPPDPGLQKTPPGPLKYLNGPDNYGGPPLKLLN